MWQTERTVYPQGKPVVNWWVLHIHRHKTRVEARTADITPALTFICTLYYHSANSVPFSRSLMAIWHLRGNSQAMSPSKQACIVVTVPSKPAGGNISLLMCQIKHQGNATFLSITFTNCPIFSAVTVLGVQWCSQHIDSLLPLLVQSSITWQCSLDGTLETNNPSFPPLFNVTC